MRLTSLIRRAPRAAAAGVAVAALAIGGATAGVAASGSQPSNAVSAGRGVNEYGKTSAFFDGKAVGFTYTNGFFCDRKVSSAASTKCEAGATFKRPPAKQFDPLVITVPLGFDVKSVDCPAKLICVDHPGTIDLSRLEKALKPLYPQLTDRQLTAALKNAPVSAHDHFIGDLNEGKAEWWDVQIVGVTDKATFQDIQNHRSLAYIQKLQREKNKNVTGTIPTNLFLFFSVQK